MSNSCQLTAWTENPKKAKATFFKALLSTCELLSHGFSYFTQGVPKYDKKILSVAGGWQCYSPGIERLSGRQSFMWLSPKKSNTAKKLLLFLYTFSLNMVNILIIFLFEIIISYTILSTTDKKILSNRETWQCCYTVTVQGLGDFPGGNLSHGCLYKIKYRKQKQLCLSFLIGSSWEDYEKRSFKINLWINIVHRIEEHITVPQIHRYPNTLNRDLSVR